uniref:C2H2-type domain-containing protein n=1 Tax=Rhodosorus marinus TaxID=101924 RepID=A0A7S2ZSQ5_9RHOD|mmetsp:Transcript_29570/g.114134  ORF Transcript_29570/g.114134 Transcript_29570/m.114134 type:complete len:133 (+) Transcript_29570:207-605(+)
MDLKLLLCQDENSMHEERTSICTLEESAVEDTMESSFTERKSAEFFCTKCLSKFTRRKNLKEHIRVVHDQDRPYGCTVCGRMFGTRNNMQRHMKMVHLGEKKFNCGTCGTGFSTKNCVIRHQRKVHKVEKLS